jgi:hypothetical protein
LGFRIFPRYFVRMASMPPYTIPPWRLVHLTLVKIGSNTAPARVLA